MYTSSFAALASLCSPRASNPPQSFQALARLHCDDEVKPAYVDEAFRLLKKR